MESILDTVKVKLDENLPAALHAVDCYGYDHPPMTVRVRPWGSTEQPPRILRQCAGHSRQHTKTTALTP